ncbi:F-box/FBD/LRR-repeat protein At2g04230-like [Asparagus officinalis]|uniref:F-box/FBD/LRR-repeat protein At2g04230-like n=1 Tax=Asparagus officinalis TaxID=4686 RepID=UPI00098DED09|nr:F-box/FBD/LRR-repeat protein At2g04230-like [Asparagus officinalis]
MERQEKESKVSQQQATSILDLPEVILMYIMSLLCTTSAAKCACVSKKWQQLWRSLPDWKLDYNSFPIVENKNEAFISLVDQVIYFHQGPGIKCMKLHYNQYDSTSLHAEGWIRHLVQTNIVRLDLDIYEQVQLPCSLFTCGTLVELRLSIFFKELPLKGNMFLPNLKILYLEQIKFSSQIQFEILMNGCPVLEHLHMKGCHFFGHDFDHVTFSHPNLKSLYLELCGGFGNLTINVQMPSLSKFRFKGIGFVDQAGTLELPSISTTVLDVLDILYAYRRRMSDGGTANYGSNMSQILASNILFNWHLSYISDFISKLIPFTYVQGYSNGIFDEERENYPQPPDILSGEMVHRNLRILEMKGCKGYGEELRTMKFLLQTAVALEKFTVDISKDEESWTVDDIQALPQPSNMEIKINIY